MLTVALIGSDGSGKTSIGRALHSSLPFRVKYMYMGPSIDSSNYALPTSRLYHYLKRSLRKRSNGGETSGRSRIRSLDEPDTLGKLGATARLLHRLAEEWYRQAISWMFQLRGYVVLYDRHFVFEFAPVDLGRETDTRRLSDRIHLWILTHIYPHPDLVFFLDAPPETLLERKPEATADYLNARQVAILKVGSRMKNFIRIDASRPLDRVIDDIRQPTIEFYSRTVAGSTKKD